MAEREGFDLSFAAAFFASVADCFFIAFSCELSELIVASEESEMISRVGCFDIDEVLFVCEPSNKRLWASTPTYGSARTALPTTWERDQGKRAYPIGE